MASIQPSITLATPKDAAPNRARDTAVARFGSFIMASDAEPTHPYDDMIKNAVRQIREDSRVLSVTEPHVEEYWCSTGDLYPSPTDEHGILTGHDAMHWIRFSDYMSFTVEVPEKNQPRLSEDDTIPTHYEVLWDGMIVLVTWRAPRGTLLGMSGGQIVEDILTEALERAGFTLYVQACEPECDHRFVHTAIRLLPGAEEQGDIEYVKSTRYAEINALLPPMGEEDYAEALYLDLRTSAAAFTELKNVGRRILDVEHIARINLDRLLSLSCTRAELPLLGRKERLERRWNLRGWRRDSNRLIAQVWRALANIELLRRGWAGERFDFEGDVTERGLSDLYVRDHADDASRIESLDLDLMRAAVESAAERLDKRALVTVTGVAAIAGALAGAIFGALAGGLF